MTEQEWLESSNPEDMVRFLRNKASERKLRLFAVAFCRLVPWEFGLLDDARSLFWRLVELAERFADGFLTRDETRAALAAELEKAKEQRGDLLPYLAEVRICLEETAECAAHAAARGAIEVYLDDPPTVMNRKAAGWLRDIWGNPFRLVSVKPAWLTPTVLALARAAYSERRPYEGGLDPDRLPVLADALDEARCDDAEILGHLRGPGPHVRGCWAVDLILGKQ